MFSLSMRFRSRLWAAASAVWAAASVEAAPFVFTKIDEIPNTLNGSYQGLQPSLSDDSVVTFALTLDGTSAPAWGIFRWENGTKTTVLNSSLTRHKGELGEPVISPDGRYLALNSKFDDDSPGAGYFDQGVSRYDAATGMLDVLDLSSHIGTVGFINTDEFPVLSGTGAQVTNGGITAYVSRIASVDPTPFNAKRRRIYLHDGVNRSVLLEDDAFAATRTLRPGSSRGFKTSTAAFVLGGMNRHGLVAFKCQHPDLAPGVGGDDGIYTVSSTGVQTIMERGIKYLPDTTFSSYVPYGVDDAGNVLIYSSWLRSPAGGPLTSSAGLFVKGPALAEPKLIAPGSFFISKGAISGNGKVVYRAQNGGTGLWTGPDVIADKVIKSGDALFGSAVSDVNIQNKSINNKGQIVFFYSLASGARGIAVATPPPTASVVVTGGNMTLQWPQMPPTSPHDFKPYSTTDLSTWGHHAGTTFANGMHSLSVSTSTHTRQFFRILP